VSLVLSHTSLSWTRPCQNTQTLPLHLAFLQTRYPVLTLPFRLLRLLHLFAPDITPSEFNDDALVMSVDMPVVSDNLEVLGPKQQPSDEDGDLDIPRHLLDFFDTVVDQGNLDDDEQDELAAILRTYALMSQTH